MNIFITKNYEQLSKKAAHIFASQLLNKPSSVLGLATGSTPLGMYKELAKFYEEGLISFKDVTTFNLDEYIGIDQKYEQSYYSVMRTALFDHIDVDLRRCNIPNGMAQDLKLECELYDKRIMEAGGIDFQVLGVGSNGHIGFNEPGAEFETMTHIVDLKEKTINDNARFFESIDDVPKKAISMGIRSIMNAKRIILLASGENKRAALKGMLDEVINPQIPASILQLHPNLSVVIDKSVADGLDLKSIQSRFNVYMEY